MKVHNMGKGGPCKAVCCENFVSGVWQRSIKYWHPSRRASNADVYIFYLLAWTNCQKNRRLIWGDMTYKWHHYEEKHIIPGGYIPGYIVRPPSCGYWVGITGTPSTPRRSATGRHRLCGRGDFLCFCWHAIHWWKNRVLRWDFRSSLIG